MTDTPPCLDKSSQSPQSASGRSGPGHAKLADQPGEEPAFTEIWPAIDVVRGFLMPGQERWLFNAVRRLDDDAVIVEIGSYLGRSTTAMAFACRGTRRRIYAIDTFKGNDSDFKNGLNDIAWEGDDYLETFKANLRANHLLKHVTPIQGFSHEIGATWEKPINFLFVDGSHEFDDVMQDYSDFYPWVKPGGMIAFHDVLPHRDGPYRAWQEHIRHQVETPSLFFSIAFGRKPMEPPERAPRTHVIIPVHNRVSITHHCLKLLMQQSIVDRLSITVVDDGSTDGMRKMLAEDYPDVRVIQGDGELFWTGAVAKAIDELRPEFAPGDFFLLVNNDAYLCPETVETLMATSEEHRRAGVAPVAISDGQAYPTGWSPNASTILNHFERQFDAMTEGGNVIEVKALFGRCSLFPVEILDRLNLGNYDAETFRHYYGDTDFCLRAGAVGLRFLITGAT
ncbi:MAG: class I SAM-dependent methyltransferase, partial [Geminicoccaceae bacterium]